MPKVKNVEKKIARTEGFGVRFKHSDGRNVRDDYDGLPQYPYTKAASNGWTVREWRDGRFKQTYPGFEVDVLDEAGATVPGNTKLATVRSS